MLELICLMMAGALAARIFDTIERDAARPKVAKVTMVTKADEG